MKSILDAVPKRIFDQTALTIEEICEKQCVSRLAVQNIRNDMMAAGEWEQVWKTYKGRTVRAYRVPKARKK